jgi:hypothetical protein
MRFFRSATWPSIWKGRRSFGLVRSPALAATCWEFNSATLIATRAHGILLATSELRQQRVNQAA